MNLAAASVHNILSKNKVLILLLSDKLVWCIFQTAALKTTQDIWGRVALFPHTLRVGGCCRPPLGWILSICVTAEQLQDLLGNVAKSQIYRAAEQRRDEMSVCWVNCCYKTGAVPFGWALSKKTTFFFFEKVHQKPRLTFTSWRRWRQ